MYSKLAREYVSIFLSLATYSLRVTTVPFGSDMVSENLVLLVELTRKCNGEFLAELWIDLTDVAGEAVDGAALHLYGVLEAAAEQQYR